MAVGDVAWVEGDHDRAVAQYEEAVELSRGTGDPLLVVTAVYNLGMAAYQGGRSERARKAFHEALELGRDLHDAPHVAAAQFMLGHLDVLAGDTRSALEHASESYLLYTDLEDARSRARCLVVLAAVAAGDGFTEDAARLLGGAEALRGDDPPDLFELRTLEQFAGDLEFRLGTAAFGELKIEGRRLEPDAVTRKVVRAGIEE